MKVKLVLEIEFESWFEDEREPKSKEDWSEFFNNYLMPEASVIGHHVYDENEHMDLIAINSYNLTCEDVS